MRLSVIQLSPSHDVRENIAMARAGIKASLSDRPDMVVLPEIWSCLGGDRATKFDSAETLPPRGEGGDGGPVYRMLRDAARSNAIVVHGGSIGERAGEKLLNTSLVFGADGRELARYSKIHLFDSVTPSGAGYRESDVYTAGDRVVTFEAGGMTVGCAICYDLRFFDLFGRLRDAGAELMVLPAAFTSETGAAHWETLIRARAIETQCWFAAAATTGRHIHEDGSARSTFGNSMIVDPWGTVVATASRGTGRATAWIDRSLTERVRRDMPVWQHRRLR